MPTSFYIFLVVAVVAIYLTCCEHGETAKELRKKGSKNRTKNILKLISLWVVASFTLIGSICVGFESVGSDNTIKAHEARITELSNNLFTTENQLTNTQFELKRAKETINQELYPKPYISITNFVSVNVPDGSNFRTTISFIIENAENMSNWYLSAPQTIEPMKELPGVVNGNNAEGVYSRRDTHIISLLYSSKIDPHILQFHVNYKYK